MPVTEFRTNTGLMVSMAGVEYPVLLELPGGMFYVEIGDQTLRASSFEYLQKQVVEARRATRFNLPFTELYASRIRHGAVTGFHARNGTLLVRWEDGTSAQLRTHDLHQPMPRLSETDDETLGVLMNARYEANKAVQEFYDARKFPKGIRVAAEQEMQRQAGVNTETEE